MRSRWGWPAEEAVRYPLLADDGYEPDLAALEELARDARLLIVNSPSNPTGAVYRTATIQALVKLAQRHDLLVLSDEVYEDLIFEGEHASPAAYDGSPVVSTFSFSKAYAMGGWRVGYAAGPASAHRGDGPRGRRWSHTFRGARPARGAGRAGRAAGGRGPHARPLSGAPGPGARPPAQGGNACARAERSVLRDPRRPRPARRHVRGGARAIARSPSGARVAAGETFGPAGRGLVRISLASTTSNLVEGVDRIVRACGQASGTNPKEV